MLGFSGAISPVLAQNKYPCKPGNFELGLFGGESYGLDRFRPMGGGNIAYGLNCHFFPFAEASYLPGILRTVDVPTGTTTSTQQYNVNMTDFHAGLHLRVPLPESRVLPYAVVGIGLIRDPRVPARFTTSATSVWFHSLKRFLRAQILP